MTVRHYVDFAPQTAVSIPINSADVVVTLLTLSGYPSAFPYLAVIDAGTVSQEVVTVSGAVGAVATIIRNQNGLGAFSHLAGATWAHMSTATDFTEANAHVNATTGTHGITGAFVGTTDTQTLTNKTISASTFRSVSAVPAITTTTDADTSHVLSMKNLAGTEKVFITGAGAVTAPALTVAGVPTPSVVTNFAALPGSPVDGQMAWTSDTELLWCYNATTTLWVVQSPRKQTYTASLDNNSQAFTTGTSGSNISTSDLAPASVPYPSLMTVRVSIAPVFAGAMTASDYADLIVTNGGTTVRSIGIQAVPSGARAMTGSAVFAVSSAASAALGTWNWHLKKVSGSAGVAVTASLDATRESLQITVEPS